MDAVGVESMDQFPAWAQDHDASLVAQLAITACQVANGGDEVAGALVAEAAGALADHVIALRPRFPSDAEIAVALGGGLLGSETPVHERLLAELATRVPNVRVTDVEVDPAFGALRMAAKKFLGLK
jgi:N-acetylglucosamine kinase-like BadF-type ATPase